MIAGACLCRLALALAMGCAALPCAALDLARGRLRTTARQITDPTVRSAFLSSPAAVLVRQLG